MIDMEIITKQVIDETKNSLAFEANGEMEAKILETSAQIAARVLEKYQLRITQKGWPIH